MVRLNLDEEFAAKVSAIEEFFEQARREEYEGQPGFTAVRRGMSQTDLTVVVLN